MRIRASVLLIALTGCPSWWSGPSATAQSTGSTGIGMSESSGGSTAGVIPDMGGDPTSSSSGGLGVTTGTTTGATTGTTTGTTATSGTSNSTIESSSTGVPMPVCGDGVVEDIEECDGLNLHAETCFTLGFSSGMLACTLNCTFDKSGCFRQGCGDGIVQNGEECDCGQQGWPCTPGQIGGKTCQHLISPSGDAYYDGTLSCGSPQSCLFDKSQCTYCGDDIINGPELCDGAALGAATCQSLGFEAGGTLKCGVDCKHDTSACIKPMGCGNMTCDNGENSCNCPADCPDDPNMCSSCECGGVSGNCACDDACMVFQDCCANGPC